MWFGRTKGEMRCLLSGVPDSGVLVAAAKVVVEAAAKVVVEAAAKVVAVVLGRGVLLSGIVGCPLAPQVKETSGPGMMYLYGLRKMLRVMPGSDLLYQFIGEDPPTSSWVPSPVTSILMQ